MLGIIILFAFGLGFYWYRQKTRDPKKRNPANVEEAKSCITEETVLRGESLLPEIQPQVEATSLGLENDKTLKVDNHKKLSPKSSRI